MSKEAVSKVLWTPPTTKPMPKEEKPRNTLLTVSLGCFLIKAALGIPLTLIDASSFLRKHPTATMGTLAAYVVLYMLQFIALFSILSCKRWGVCSYLTSVVLMIGLNLFVAENNRLFMVFFELAVVSVFLYERRHRRI